MKFSASMIDEFRKDWSAGLFGTCRYGQAFYNHFKLHRVSIFHTKIDEFEELWDCDRSRAEEIITSFTDWGN